MSNTMNNEKTQGDDGTGESNHQQERQALPGGVVLPFDQRRRARQQRPIVETVGERPPPPPPPPPPPLSDNDPLLSATTAETIPAPSGPKPHPHHRGVSWGDINVSFAPPPTEFSMTASTETIPTATGGGGGGGSSSPSQTSRRLMTGQEAYEAAEAALQGRDNNNASDYINSTRIKLDDLMQLHPMETEAETHILRALEQTDLAMGPDSSSDMAILGNVPHEALYPPVPLPPMEGDDDEGMMEQQQQQQPSSTTRLHKNSNRTLGSSDQAGGGSQAVASTPTFTTPVVDAVWNNDFTELPPAASVVSAGTSTRSFRHATINNQHRRQKTMEQTLSSLTSALEDMHQQNRPRAGTTDNGPSVMSPYLTSLNMGATTSAIAMASSPPMEQESQNQIGSADALAQNINLLFRSSEPTTTTADEFQPLMTTASGGEGRVRLGTADGNVSNGPARSDVSSDQSNNTASKARKNWSLLKETIIQNGPAAVTMMGEYSDNCTTGGINTQHHINMETVPESDVEMGTSDEVDNTGNDDGDRRKQFHEPAHGKRQSSWIRRVLYKLTCMRNVDEFLQPRRQSLWTFIKATTFIILPCLGVSFLFYYVLDNPNTTRFTGGRNVPSEDTDDENDSEGKASISWWILFLGVRQVVTFSLAHFLELVFVDFICLEQRWSLVCFGPTLTLLIVQSKGWPCLLFFWSILDLALLCGDFPLATHWGHWQNWLDIFNEENPAGDFVSSEENVRIILVVLGFSIVVAIKRFLIGFYQGRKLFVYYANDLAAVMKKILLVSQVAALALQLERERIEEEGDQHETANVRASRAGIDVVVEENAGHNIEKNDDDDSLADSSAPRSDAKLIPDNDDEDYGLLSRVRQRKIDRVLGNWIEPDATPRASHGDISIKSILQFRTSMAQLGKPFPFSYAFGRASTRQECIESAQNVFLCLLAETPGEKSLSFNVLALTALRSDGTLVPEKIRDLMQIFRPNHKGCLTLVDFCKSVDSLYKELRLLRASVRNSQKIDQSFERIFNVVFYTILICVCLALLGFDPLALFLSLSSFALAFSFMISRASSTYFDGLLFILCRRPYDIGDRIVVQGVESETSWNGTTDWIVKDIDLFKTTIIYAYTNECATVSNGSLANSRIMNGARSDPAFIYVLLRFGIDVTYGQLEIFKEALTRYVEARPRDWTKLWCLRALDVKADEGYVEYMVCVESRDNWQDVFHLWHIRGVIKAFCHELAKQLEMRYISPPMPVDIRMRGSLDDAMQEDQRRLAALTSGISADSEAIQRMIQDRNR